MLSESEMLSILSSSITEKRLKHTLGVVQTADTLAIKYGADVNKCHIAALLHDCAKSMSKEDMLASISASGIPLYKGEEDVEPVLHAPAGAAIAQRVYGVTDSEILSAIRKHTVGAKDMSLIDAIIYVADFIEPGRKYFDGLDTVRQIAERDIYAAVKECARLTMEYCRDGGKTVFVPA